MLAYHRIAFQLCQFAGGFDFKLSLNSLASPGLIILTLAICGPRERCGEFSFGDEVSLFVGTVAGTV